jgi:hypothetical protein
LNPGRKKAVHTVLTDPGDLDLVSRALPAHGFTVLSAKLGYKAKNPLDPASLNAEQMAEVEAFLAAHRRARRRAEPVCRLGRIRPRLLSILKH